MFCTPTRCSLTVPSGFKIGFLGKKLPMAKFFNLYSTLLSFEVLLSPGLDSITTRKETQMAKFNFKKYYRKIIWSLDHSGHFVQMSNLKIYFEGLHYHLLSSLKILQYLFVLSHFSKLFKTAKWQKKLPFKQ